MQVRKNAETGRGIKYLILDYSPVYGFINAL